MDVADTPYWTTYELEVENRPLRSPEWTSFELSRGQAVRQSRSCSLLWTSGIWNSTLALGWLQLRVMMNTKQAQLDFNLPGCDYRSVLASRFSSCIPPSLLTLSYSVFFPFGLLPRFFSGCFLPRCRQVFLPISSLGFPSLSSPHLPPVSSSCLSPRLFLLAYSLLLPLNTKSLFLPRHSALVFFLFQQFLIVKPGSYA